MLPGADPVGGVPNTATGSGSSLGMTGTGLVECTGVGVLAGGPQAGTVVQIQDATHVIITPTYQSISVGSMIYAVQGEPE